MIEHIAQLGPPGAIVARRGLPVGATLLDAAGPLRDTGRFAALAVAPEAILEWSLADGGDPFAQLAALAPAPVGGAGGPWPRVTCALGYDLGRAVEQVPAVAHDEGLLPDLWAARYPATYVWDRLEERGTIRAVSAGAARDLRAWCTATDAVRSAVVRGPAQAEMSRAHYDAAIERILAHIQAGDVYQVNFAMRFSAPISPGDPAALFGRLHARSPVPFAAALRIAPDRAVLSVSPERFLAWDAAGRVETRPIKGTRPRRATPAADRAEAAALAASEKDAAEHVMIVDLQRNDLGRICRPGSVQVARLAAPEAYSTVHHLVSVVEGQRRDPRDLAGLLRATFPGGSITGAPKISALHIIDRLEPVRRGIYCGSVGYLDADGGGDLNIAIRTAVIAGGRLYYSAGGGIVADSAAAAEWDEVGHKARAFIEALG